VTKNSPPEELFSAIDRVINGEVYICSEIQLLVGEKPLSQFRVVHPFYQLTAREQYIARLIKRGLSSQAISEELHVSIRTVDTHRYNILKKLHIKSTVQLVNFMNTESQKII
jgi:DNA-binding NarL/FixJ family response regulator